MGVEPKIGVGPPNHPILIVFSIIFTIHFGVPLFLETPISDCHHHQKPNPPRAGAPLGALCRCASAQRSTRFHHPSNGTPEPNGFRKMEKKCPSQPNIHHIL